MTSNSSARGRAERALLPLHVCCGNRTMVSGQSCSMQFLKPVRGQLRSLVRLRTHPQLSQLVL